MSDTETMHRDLARILTALGLSAHARDASPHEIVLRDVLPAIEKLKAAEPEEIAKAKAQTLRAAADAIRTTEILFRRGDGSVVTVNDLLREMAERYESPGLAELRAALDKIAADDVLLTDSGAAEILYSAGVRVEGGPR